MNKVKKIFETIFLTLLVMVFTIGVGYLGYFKLVPLLWSHHTSYAFQSMITAIIAITIAVFYLLSLCIQGINETIALFKPTQPTTEESKT